VTIADTCIMCSDRAIYTGVFADRFCLWVARRHKGLREPEDRLQLGTVLILLAPAALILWGVGAAKTVAWPGLVVGMGMLAASMAIGAAISISYAIDSYKAVSAEAVTAVIVVRNCMSFAIGYGITPWIDGQGLQNCFVAAAMISLGCFLTILPFLKWGKSMRRKSGPMYYDFVDTGRKAGVHLDL
jgi:MFS family permease